MSDEIKKKVRLEYYDKAQDINGDILKEYRELWDAAFHDPDGFTDYYFRCVCGKNRLLGAYMGGSLIGMLHMNPYTVRMEAQVADCYYIVGVAVRESMRRQGIMRLMMERALRDMSSENCPITFLMPGRQEYYAGFGFEMVYDTKVLRINVNRLMQCIENRIYNETYEIEDMSQYTSERLAVLSWEINNLLGEHYSFFADRTPSYLRDMAEEHLCQNGAVRVIYEQKRPRCVFSYDIYDETMYVERFEPLGGNVLHMLREIFDFAVERGCSSMEITVPACESAYIEADWQEYIQAGMIQLTEGCGIMALALTEDEENASEEENASDEQNSEFKCCSGNYLDKMKNVSFFDEIV